MGLVGGGFLRLFQTFLYAVAFCCSGIVLGVYSYFLAVLSDRNAAIGTPLRAITGISGFAALYTMFAIVLTCCLGGISFFAFLAIAFNVAFVGGFIALAVLTRTGVSSCTGNNVQSPLGNGPANAGNGFGADGFGVGSDNNSTYSTTFGTACTLNKAAFAVSVGGIFLFILLSLVQVLLVRHHKKEKRFGPSPANNYTSGSGRGRFWRRNRNKGAAGVGATGAGANGYATRDTELGGVDTRPSHDTGYTGSTMAAPPQTGYVKDAEPIGTTHGHSSHGRYYTQPEGTGVNPYGGYHDTSYNGAAPARNF